MKITLEVPPYLVERLRECTERDGEEASRRSVEAAFASTLLTVLTPTPSQLSLEEFDALVEEMDLEWETDGCPGEIVPADRLITREDIYRDHL